MKRKLKIIISDLNQIVRDLAQIHTDHFDDTFGYTELIDRELNIYKRIKKHKKTIYTKCPELIQTYEELEKINKSYN